MDHELGLYCLDDIIGSDAMLKFIGLGLLTQNLKVMSGVGSTIMSTLYFCPFPMWNYCYNAHVQEKGAYYMKMLKPMCATFLGLQLPFLCDFFLLRSSHLNACDEQDIGFSVEYVSPSGETTLILPYRRYESDQGNFCTILAGCYKLIWDNSYSAFFKKSLRYKVDAIPPVVEPPQPDPESRELRGRGSHAPNNDDNVAAQTADIHLLAVIYAVTVLRKL
ncbi:hypothetical protein Taro_018776, partial [Colocasia esculenta]|nr:hypothetical protein [Colocasia esculenta]